MPRTPWVFNNYSFPTNPERDSGWTTELNFSEKSAINSGSSRLQYNSTKSPRRQTSGYCFGENAITQRNTMDGWLRNRTQATLIDHNGVARKAQLIRFSAEAVNDVRAYKDNRATFRFDAEWIGVD